MHRRCFPVWAQSLVLILLTGILVILCAPLVVPFLPPPGVLETLDVNGETRSYYLFEPEERPASGPVPLVFMLQGFDSPGDPSAATRDLYWQIAVAARRHGFIAVFPRGRPGSYPDVPGVRAWCPAGWLENRTFLLRLLDALKRRYPIDPDRIILAGFSNGAYFASVEVTARPDSPFTGFWLDGGGYPYAFDTRIPRRPVFLTWGLRDKYNASYSSELFWFLADNGWTPGGSMHVETHEWAHVFNADAVDRALAFLLNERPPAPATFAPPPRPATPTPSLPLDPPFSTSSPVSSPDAARQPANEDSKEDTMKSFLDAHVSWLGHDGFRLTGAKTVYIDPFKITGGKKADLILFTHEHFDHCSPEDVQKIQDAHTILVGPADALAKLSGDKRPVKPGDRLTEAGVTIEVVPAYNTNKKFHPKANAWVGYIVTFEGKRIYHAGDTDHIPEMKAVKADIALLPVSGTYVMTAEEAASAALEIKPAAAVPMHYGSIVGEKSDAERFRDALRGKIDVFILPAS